MATSEIEKLERRFAENPHGLTFAPLAEVHRKNGDISRALELLRVGLELHPNYIPASIVLGRCHQDMGDLPAAAEAFAHVLRLDDENVIALKSLADITEREDRLDDAEQWLRRLVSVDRSNDEARLQLERVEAAKEKSRRSAPAPAPVAAELSHEIALVDAARRTPSVPPAATAARGEPTEAAPLDLTDELKKEAVEPVLEPSPIQEKPRTGSTEPRTGELVLEPEPPVADAEPAPLPGLETAEFEPPKSSPGPLGLEIETESDVVLNSSGASEFSVPDASQEFAALAAKLNASRPRSPGRRASDRAAVEPPASVAKTEPTGKTITPVVPPQPSAPAQPLTGAGKGYSARDTNGQSIAAFFQVLRLARPPADSATPSAKTGATRFDEGPRSNSGPKEEPASSPAGSGSDGLVSFDDFFGAGTGGGSGASGGEPGKDDLDQFHSWLQNLKR
jgi:tetratricopeptide (TPR) repeat protein